MLKRLGIALTVAAAWGFALMAGPAPSPVPSKPFLERAQMLADWTVANSRYGKMKRMPSFLFLPAETINYLNFNQTAQGYSGQKRIMAMYLKGIVVLPDTFKPGADDYKLVHELVHHLQWEAGAEFACWGERELEAHEIQNQFVKETGRGLKSDRLWMLSTLQCGLLGY